MPSLNGEVNEGLMHFYIQRRMGKPRDFPLFEVILQARGCSYAVK